MANRHLARSIVMQTLFQWDFMGLPEKEALVALTNNIAEFAPGSDDSEFMEKMFLGVVRKKTVIDNIIEKAAPDWPISKINGIDLNIIRVGLFELLFGDKKNVPPKVAINEAIEIAKAYSGDSAGRFVNGVLGAVYKEMGEPGKNDKGKKDSEFDESELPVETKIGAFIYSNENGNLQIALVHDVFGFWTFPKILIPEGENPEETFITGILEKLALPVVIKKEIGQSSYISNRPGIGKLVNKVIYYVVEAPFSPMDLAESGGTDDAKWFTPKELPELRIYEDVTELIAKSIDKLTDI